MKLTYSVLLRLDVFCEAMAEHVSRLETVEKKLGVLQELLTATRRSNREEFKRQDGRLNSLEGLSDRVADDVRRHMDDAAQRWWARMQQHHQSEVARQMDLLREQMIAVEEELKKLHAQHVASYQECLDRLQRTAADCTDKVELVRSGLEKREARLGTLERRCREMLEEKTFRKESSLPVAFARNTCQMRSQERPGSSAPSSPAGSAAGRASSCCPSDSDIRARLENVNHRLRARTFYEQGRGRETVRLVEEAQRTALRARTCSVEPGLVLRMDAARAEAARRKGDPYWEAN